MVCCFATRTGTPDEPPPDPVDNDFFLNPYTADSAHHRPIGSGADYAAAGHPETVSWRKLNGAGIGVNLNIGFPFGRPIYRIVDNSPRVNVNRSSPYDGNYQNVPATDVPMPAAGIPEMKPGRSEDDSSMAFAHGGTGLIHCFRGTDQAPGYPSPYHNFTAGSYTTHWALLNGDRNIGRTSGLGHGLKDGDRVSTGAAGAGLLFGVVRASELNGTQPIRHVLVVCFTRKGILSVNMLGTKHVLPAVATDKVVTGTNLGDSVYGRIHAVRPDTNLGSFGFSPLQIRIATCLRDYGLIPLDAGGAMAFRADQACTTAHRDAIRDVVKTLVNYMYPVLNSAWDPSNRRKPTGGGTPIAINSAYDA